MVLQTGFKPSHYKVSRNKKKDLALLLLLRAWKRLPPDSKANLHRRQREKAMDGYGSGGGVRGRAGGICHMDQQIEYGADGRHCKKDQRKRVWIEIRACHVHVSWERERVIAGQRLRRYP